MMIDAVRSGDGPALHTAIQEARIKVVNKLLKEGVEPFTLGFEEDNEGGHG
jgi:hypothetical protein